jgi:hypothetical protein
MSINLQAVGILAGLTAPYSMSQLSGRFIYDSIGNRTTVPSVNISLNLFLNKTFTSPENPLKFFSFFYGTISSNGKVATFTGGTLFGSMYMGDGNNIPVYINIAMTGFRQNAQVEIGSNGKNTYIIGVTTLNRSVYLQNGDTSISNSISYFYPTTLTVSITNSAQYSDVVNFVY